MGTLAQGSAGYGDSYGSGYGNGYGYGYGYSYGSGYGNGYGYGYGYSYGYGSGYGYGYGSGYGSGDGDGDGYGDGYGNGDGSGYGYGNGDMLKEHLAAAYTVPMGWEGSTLAVWRSDAEGRPANGGHGDAVGLGTVQEVEGPLEACSSHALHASLSPDQWKGKRWWVVALAPPVVGTGDKLASLRRLVLAEL